MFLFLLLCVLAFLFFSTGLDDWGQRQAEHIALLRDDFGTARKDSLLKKLGLPRVTHPQTGHLVEGARNDLSSLPVMSLRAVAIRVAEADLSDPEKGLQTNSRQRGREWERPAGVAVLRNGQELLAAPAGIRLQGNRATRDMLHSFRLYFRASYGENTVPGSAFLDDAHMNVRKIVLRKEKNPVPGFVTMLAFDVARRVGSMTPDYAPVHMFLNGRSLGLGLASEHVNRTHWERRLGHRNFAFYVLEAENSVLDSAQYKALRFRLDPFFGLWEYDRVAEILDVNDFMRAMTCFAFVQWQDWNQGALILDRTEAGPRWKSVLWDADLAFAGLRSDGVPENRAGWKNLRDAHGLRAAVFKGMWENSQQFREEFLRLLSWTINHRLTRAWIEERIRHYTGLETDSGLDCFDAGVALTYLLQRRVDLLAETTRDLGAPDVIACRVESPQPVVVDDERVTTSYEGLYFRGQAITLAPQPHASFSHWIVDERHVHEPRLTLELQRDTVVRAAFFPSANPS
ncbi:MAG: hypothetical protein GXY42_01055 [Desulfovibrionales bacterium]|nr:hypothetical protein [Desulfovibrionales bacterium]